MAILKGVGVGDSSATPLAATITWMLKGLAAPSSDPPLLSRLQFLIFSQAFPPTLVLQAGIKAWES